MKLSEKMALDRAKAVFEHELLPMLSKMYQQGQTEFRLAMQMEKHFIVHAIGRDSKTIDINWNNEGVSYSHTFNDHELSSQTENNGGWIDASVDADFDGEYLGQIERKEECGEISKIHRVIINRMNKWVLEPNEKLFYWRKIPQFEYDTHAPGGCPL